MYFSIINTKALIKYGLNVDLKEYFLAALPQKRSRWNPELSPNCSFVTAIIHILCSPVLFYIPQKNYLDKSCIFFKVCIMTQNFRTPLLSNARVTPTSHKEIRKYKCCLYCHDVQTQFYENLHIVQRYSGVRHCKTCFLIK